MPQITESRPLAEATRAGAPSGNLRVLVITPGWGSSGYYSESMLREAASRGVIGAGTHMYADHMAESEWHERPERSVRDIAAVTTSAGTWDETEGGIVAEARVLPAFREAFTDEVFLEATGVSIHGSAITAQGDAAGRSGTLITELTEVLSVDFVTHAGRGGRVLEVLESAHARVDADPAAAEAAVREAEPAATPSPTPPADPEQPTPGEGEPQPTADPVPAAPAPTQTREALPGGLTGSGLRSAISNAVDAAYDQRGDNGTGYVWSYVRDWTDDTVVFSLSGDGAPTHRLWAQSFTVSDAGVATLTGEAQAVVVETRYLTVGVDGAPGAPVFTAIASADEAARATLRLDDRSDDDPTSALAEALRGSRRPEPPSQQPGSTTESHREGTTQMPMVDEGRLRQLEADAQRAATLETQLAEAERRGEVQERRAQVAEARSYATDFARARVREANPNLASGAVERVVATATREIPLVESGDLAGRLDTTALGRVVDEARTTEETYLAELLAESGVGSVRGVGDSSGPETDAASDAAVEEALNGLFRRDTVKG